MDPSLVSVHGGNVKCIVVHIIGTIVRNRDSSRRRGGRGIGNVDLDCVYFGIGIGSLECCQRPFGCCFYLKGTKIRQRPILQTPNNEPHLRVYDRQNPRGDISVTYWTFQAARVDSAGNGRTH